MKKKIGPQMTTRKIQWEMFWLEDAHIDPQTGEVCATTLAEDTANSLNHPEWLDDPQHEVWDLAAEVAERQAARQAKRRAR